MGGVFHRCFALFADVSARSRAEIYRFLSISIVFEASNLMQLPTLWSAGEICTFLSKTARTIKKVKGVLISVPDIFDRSRSIIKY